MSPPTPGSTKTTAFTSTLMTPGPGTMVARWIEYADAIRVTMQRARSYRTNRDLFSNHYLDEHLPETAAWDAVAEAELREAREEILELWEREKETAPQRNESQLEEKFIRPMFRKLGIPFEVEEKTSRTQRVPDYGFFESDDAARQAFDRREEGGDFYEDAVAVADAKRWGRPLDTRGSGEHERDFENPSYQIHYYLRETAAKWAVLTDGRKWRLYFGPTSHRLDSYYEIDLPTVLEAGDLEAFKYFYLFFRHDAFLEDASGDSFLDDVYEESNVFARELGEDLQDNIYEAIRVLAEGFLGYPENELSKADLELVHDSSLIYLYRVIFVLYAEAEGRELLDTDNEFYETSYSLNALKQDIAEELDSADPRYRDWQDDLWSRLGELFKLIDRGSEARGIPEDDLYIPAYNGGLFRTAPDADDSPEARFLAEHAVGDAHLARVIDLLTRSRNGNGGGTIFVDYSSLDVRHLGSIYEGLLEYQLNIAEEPLALDDGEYVQAGEADEVRVDEGEVYLTTGSGERKATGSYYTPEYVVEYIVENTLGPLVTEIREDLAGQSARDEGGFAAEFADRVFELKVLDPAMGSGHFLTNAVDFLAREIIDAQERQAAQEGIETVDEDRDINWARRQVAQRCIYGVDLNPLATELSKVSLWLRTLAAEQPLAFLDHHLKTGNSLVGSDIEDVLENGDPDDEVEAGQLTLHQSFDRTQRQALDHVTDRFQALLAIDNETLDDVKEMEAVFDEVRDGPLYRHLLAMANVHTADAFGLDVPADAYERMAAALRDGSWAEVEDQDWFRSAQAMAAEERFFHWELEFPVAFYGEDGERDEDAGFDAVIGNPPYVSNWQLTESNEDLPEMLEGFYPEVTTGHWDLYVPFAYRGAELTRAGGYQSFITPNALATEKYGVDLRKYFITECRLEKLVTFEEFRVFDQVDRQYLIYVVSPHSNGGKCDIVRFDGRSFYADFSIDPKKFLEYSNNSFRIDLTAEDMDLKDKTDEQSVRLGQFCFVGPGVVAHSAEDSPLDFSKDDVVDSEPGKGKKRYLDGGNEIQRHELRWGGKYIDYESNQEHFHRPKFPAQFESPKIIFARVSGADNAIKSCYDDEGFYTNDSALHAVQWTPEIGEYRQSNNYQSLDNVEDYNLRYVAALVNSRLISYYFSHFLATGTLQGSYSGVYPEDVRQLPIPCIEFETSAEVIENLFDEAEGIFEDILDSRSKLDELARFVEEAKRNDVTHRMLSYLCRRIIEFKQSRTDLNLDLLNYLGNYTDGSKLPDVGLFQPTSTDILDATTEDLEKLNIGEVRTERNGSSVTIYATARYKPEDEAEHETDRWGYTETDYLEAFTLADHSETEAALVEAFVPVAVEEGAGFAGFRDNATKTTSLVDRLKSITLPDPDDVEDDLRRYTETRDRADELDAKIEKTDRLIDEIVYELYELTNEEIAIVEASVRD